MIEYAFIVCAFLSYAGLHSAYRIAGRREYRPQVLNVLFMGSAAIMAGVMAYITAHPGAVMPPEYRAKFVALAIGAGSLIPVGIVCYTLALKYGKLAPSATTMSLSALIPISGSIIIYHEKLTPVRMLAIALAICAIILLWLDKRNDEKEKPDVV